jgi:hypothetical protein
MLKSKTEGNAAMKRFGKAVEKKIKQRRVRQASKQNAK